jgi:D-alanine transaminase
MKEVMPVVKLDDEPVGDGKPGPITRQMFQIFQSYKNELKKEFD